jgi:AICAR transformylase/IMP cyclohydrolase PurH/REP element-mobilizing transposase RayT
MKIRRALISVWDKTGIVDFARALHNEFGVEIISTGGTAKTLREAGIPVTLIEDITGFPELLDGRVKTLHPKIHAAILADRDNPEHMRQLEQHGIQPIDMVVVNLYPFEKTVADPNCTFEQAIEMIDIGGVALLRAAAKNHEHVLVVSNSVLFDRTLAVLRGSSRYSVADLCDRGALAAFGETAWYDDEIYRWLPNSDGARRPYEQILIERMRTLRYGENPTQTGEAFDWLNERAGTDLMKVDRTCDRSYDNPALSYNNYVDADAALGLCAELARANKELWHRFPTGESGMGITGFQPVSDEQFTRRNLPHIQRPGATYFITFRLLRGSLSAEERDVVLSACQFWHTKSMTLHAAVIMPDHVHLLMTPHECGPGQFEPIGKLLHSIKRFSSLEINKRRGTSGPLWLDENFDRIVRDEAEFIEKWEYMQANPVTAGICAPGQYPWFWKSDTGFMETISQKADAVENHRLKTGATNSEEPRLKTGATNSEEDRSKTGATKVCVFIKHTNACGVGVAAEPLEAYRRAYLGDPNAAMGGILACNFSVNADFAAAVMETYDRLGKPLKEAGATHAPGGFFVEVWVAPSFEDDAVPIIRTRKKWGENVRLLAVGDMSIAPDPDELQYRSIAGGMLVQTPDVLGLNEEQWKVVTKRSPTESEMADLRLAWLICKHTKSNAITMCKDGMLIGNGAGQMSRVMSCRIATWLAKENGHTGELAGSAAASDAFFPFRDGPEILIQAGVKAIIQPGGSKRDEDTIAACDERGVAMIFSGTRHFRH